MGKLEAWLKKEKISQSELARQLGVDTTIVCKWLMGLRRPNVDNALAIERLTRSEVPVESWQRRRRGRAA